MRKFTRHGYSLIELVVVILIIGILAVAGVGFGGKQISNARMNTISNNLKIVGNDIENAIVDIGFLTKDEIENQSTATEYFREWDKKYMTSPLNLDTVTTSASGDSGDYGSSFSGACVDTIGYTDPWGNELKIFYLAPAENGNYRIVVASAGPNGKWADDAIHAYIHTGETDTEGNVVNNLQDDVVLIMEPRL